MNLTQTAIVRLTLGTAAWGLSFPAAKAVMQAQAMAAPGHAEWIHAALILFNRMILGALILLAILGARRRGFTRLEMRQGVELGLFGGLGMMLQTDAQNYIAASTSAFFTQFTCVFVPVVVAIRSRRLPSTLVTVACVLVMAGCTVLSGVSFGDFHLGRGEWETIAGAALFTGQILCLERSRFRENDPERTATLMFSVKALVAFSFLSAGGSASVARVYTSPAVLGLTAFIAVVCTVYAYAVMVRWQPKVTATQAGLIYATEPVFTSIWALFLPGWLSSFAGISYPNEILTWQLLAGGTLILIANILLIARPGQLPHGDPPAIT